MKANLLQANHSSARTNTVAESILIFRYDSDTVSIKSRVTLEQNLFSFLLEGEKTVYYPGTTVKIKSDQFMLLSAGNCLMSEKIAAQDGMYRSILLFFDNQILADFFFKHPEILRTVSRTDREESFLVFEKDAFLYHFIESLVCILTIGQPVSANMRLVKLYELLLYLGENYPGQLQTLRNLGQEADDHILLRQAVEANINNSVTVEELAFLCNMSLSTFKRRFAKVYGTSPGKWLLEKRMQKAA